MINLALSGLRLTVDVNTHDSGHLLNSFHVVNIVGLILFGINTPVPSFLDLLMIVFMGLITSLYQLSPHSWMLYPYFKSPVCKDTVKCNDKEANNGNVFFLFYGP